MHANTRGISNLPLLIIYQSSRVTGDCPHYSLGPMAVHISSLIVRNIFPKVTDSSSPCNSQLSEKQIEEASVIYKKGPLSRHQKCINEEAAKIAKQNPALLIEHGRLLVLARKAVIDSGYQFKKGRSRSKMFGSGDKSPKPKRQKTDAEIRMARVSEINGEIEQLNRRIHYKEKMLRQAETSKKYKVCDELAECIHDMTKEKKTLEKELSLWIKKEK